MSKKTANPGEVSRPKSNIKLTGSSISLQNLKKELDIRDHTTTVQELIAKYQTNVKSGLSSEKAARLLEEHGPNTLMTVAPQSKLMIFLKIVFTGFACLLWIGAVLSFIAFIATYRSDPSTPLDHIYLSLVLVIVVILTSIITFIQESKNSQIVEGFSKMIPKFATVVRDDTMSKVPVQDLVIGDLIELEAGDCVPADIRIITSNGLKVDNSPITGECEFQPRSNKCTDANPLETENLVFFGTNVAEGVGEGIVIGCGKNTLIGHIAGLTMALKPEELPIKKELNEFIYLISIIAILTGTGFFFISISIGYGFFDSMLFFIAIVIANVPEGLLVTLTVCLTLTAQKMAAENCLVKNLAAIETLGSTDVICSDKTGTLTQNRMTVAHMFFDQKEIDLLEYNNNDKSLNKMPGFEMLTRVGILCMRAEFKLFQENVSVQKLQVIGDASESAVLKAMEKLVGRTVKYRSDWPKVCEIPFTSDKKYQLSIHRRQNEKGYLLVMKGAPEIVLDRCGSYYNKGTESLSPAKKKDFLKEIFHLGYMGERVMGFADLELPISQYPENYHFNTTDINFPMANLRFVGLMAMIDPPRPNVPEAVLKCKTAGIRVIMVTGDHPITGVAIARKVGIIGPKNESIYDICMRRQVSITKITAAERKTCTAGVVTGAELRVMTQEEIEKVLVTYKEIVFARTSPQQKLKIVESFQHLGAIVAVTGDGVNDSPALKKADIGVAMGISGSDVSKDAADMIILDDNFASIVTGIEEGRLVFDNLKKSIAYVLTSNVPEIIPFCTFVILNTPPMLSILTIILIDVGTDLWPAISLAYEKPEHDIMLRKPRDQRVDKLVNNRLMCLTYLQIGIIQTCGSFLAWFYTMAAHGFFYDRLIGIRDEWESPLVNNLQDSYGNEWTFEERKVLERKGYATYFMSLVITQIADALIAKTRKLSLVQQGMSNMVLNSGIVFVILLTAFAIYTPGINRALNFEPIELFCVLPVVPFAIFIVVFDECRRCIIRRYPTGWVARETYY